MIVVLSMKVSRTIQYNINLHLAIKKQLMKNEKSNLRTHLSFLKMILINLFCSEKVFIVETIWMNGKSLMKHHELKKKNFIAI